MRVLVEAAATDPELARLRAQIGGERRNGQGSVAQLLADRGLLRPDLPVQEAGDPLWTLSSLTVYDLLVRQRGWTPERYRDWLAAALARELLPG
jgi:prophage antirepressor-like protein